MTDDRDICERLEDQSLDGAIYLRLNAAKEIRALRHYVARLEDELLEEEYQHGRTIIKLENAREHISDQALDIATLGQEVGRLREALGKCRPLLCRAHDRIHALPRATDTELANEIDTTLGGIRAALAEKGEK